MGYYNNRLWITKFHSFSIRKKVVGRLLRHRPHFLFWVDNDIFFLFKEIKPDIIFIKMDRRGRRSLQKNGLNLFVLLSP